MADYNVLSQGARPFNALAAIQGGQQVQQNNQLMQEHKQALASEHQYNQLLGQYLGQNSANTLSGGPPPVDVNQLYAMDPQRTMQVQQFQAQQQAAQQAQQVDAARQAITKAQFVLGSKEPGKLVKTAFPEVWDQLVQLGNDPENFTPEKWRDEAQQMIAHYGPTAGLGPAGQGEQFTLGQGQTRFDAHGNRIATVAPAPTDKDPTDKTFTRANTLRDEFTNQTGAFQTIRSAYENVKSATPGDAGDTALVLNFMRTISPGIRIQPGEAITDAASVPGVSDKFISLWNKVTAGGKLSDTQRTEIRNQAKASFDTQQGLYNSTKKRYRDLAKRAGVDEVDVIGDEDGAAPDAAANGKRSFANEAEAEAAGLKPGTRVVIGGVKGTWQ